jgi:hypothetical protein
MHTNRLSKHVVVNGEGKPFGQATVISVNDLMNPGEKKEGIDV